MKKENKKENYEYVYLENPIMLPPVKKKQEKQEASTVIVIDLNDDNGINVVDFNIL